MYSYSLISFLLKFLFAFERSYEREFVVCRIVVRDRLSGVSEVEARLGLSRLNRD